MIWVLQGLSRLAIPVFIVFILLYGFGKKVPIYEVF